jgi:hypothetical protein
MEPLDLRLAAPRGPRTQIAGIVFTARVVDKLRASLPGGELNGYFPFIGFSELWAYYTGIALRELQGVVVRAASEAEVEAWIAERTAHVDKPKINGKMERFESSRTSGERCARCSSARTRRICANGTPCCSICSKPTTRGCTRARAHRAP